MRLLMALAVIGLVGYGIWASEAPPKAGAAPKSTFVYEAIDGSIVECDMTPPATPPPAADVK